MTQNESNSPETKNQPPDRLDFHVVSIFPEMFESPFGHSIFKRARDAGHIGIHPVQLRDYTTDKHKTTDDTPFGGGAGMVMLLAPLVEAIKDLRAKNPGARTIMFSPRGRPFTQKVAHEYATGSARDLILVCGRYEGIDARFRAFVDDEVSVGDYVLTGGEIAGMAFIDAVGRLVPGVVGNELSVEEESFSPLTGLLEYPHYTRPAKFGPVPETGVMDELPVPEVLQGGNHALIEKWRRERALLDTYRTRPEMIDPGLLKPGEKEFLLEHGGRGKIFLALVHYPVYNKFREVVTSSLTTLDLHDLARLAASFALESCWMVTPLKSHQDLARVIMGHWLEGFGAEYNPRRKTALGFAKTADSIANMVEEIESTLAVSGQKNKSLIKVATSAAPLKKGAGADGGPEPVKFAELRRRIYSGENALILLGTGWGLTKEAIGGMDLILEPVSGAGEYNHLSVRSAASIIIDRLAGWHG